MTLKLTQEESKEIEKEVLVILKEYFNVDSLDALGTEMAANIMTTISKSKAEVGSAVVEKILSTLGDDPKTDETVAHAEMIYRSGLLRALAICMASVHYSTFGDKLNINETVRHFSELAIAAYLAANNLGGHAAVDIVPISINKDSN